MKIHDVSVPIRDGGLVYPGNPPIHIELQQAIAKGASSNVSHVDFGSHTGTHVDAPRHFSDTGAGVDQIPLDLLIGPATVVSFGDDVRAVTRADLERHDLGGVERVLLHTRNSTYLTQDPTFHPDFTYLAPDGAAYLVSLGVRLVAIDYLSIDRFHSGNHPTHHALLDAGVTIVEGVNLDGIPDGRYQLCCLPLRLEGVDGAPARAVLIEQ
jgi:arylformamidase